MGCGGSHIRTSASVSPDHLHPPTTPAAKSAAAVARQFVASVRQGSARKLCTLLREEARVEFGCGRKASIPGWLTQDLRNGRPARVIDSFPGRTYSSATEIGFSVEPHRGDIHNLGIEVDSSCHVVDVGEYGYQ